MTEFTLDIKLNSDLHTRILQRLNDRWRTSARKMQNIHDKWRRNEEQHVAWLPERDVDARRRLLREQSGQPQYTTIVLPYTYAMQMSSWAYAATVFLSRNPILQFMGRHGESENQVMGLEALIDYQVRVGEMLIPLYFWLHDSRRYGVGILGNYWMEEVQSVSRMQEVPDVLYGMNLGTSRRELVTEEIRGYYGNKLFNIRPYDWYPDPRVPMHAVQTAEFQAFLSEVGWNQILRRSLAGEYVNIEMLKKEGGTETTGREPGSTPIELPNDDQSFTSETNEVRETGPYGMVTEYVDVIAPEWGLPGPGRPEKWVFEASVQSSPAHGGRQGHLKYIHAARPLGCYHGKFPIDVIQSDPEPYAFASRGMPEIMQAMQNTMDWLINCYDDETEVLTECGWLPIAAVDHNTEVATLDSKSRRFWFEKPSAVFHREYEGPMVEFDSKRYNACVTPNHKMWVRKRYKGEWRFEEAMALAKQFGGEWQTISSGLEWEGREIEGVEVDDFLEFLGYFATDGHAQDGRLVKSGSYTVRLDQNAGPAFEKMADCFERVVSRDGYYRKSDTSAGNEAWQMYAGRKDLALWLRENIKTNSFDVRVPVFVKQLCRRQLKIFFDACMLGDGYKRAYRDNLLGLVSASKRFVDDLQEVALKLGHGAAVVPDGKYWRLTVNTEAKDAALTHRHNISLREYKGAVHCFTNSTHLTLTRRNGKCVVASQSHMYNVRKTLNNQWLVDPSRVVMTDFENGAPGGAIKAKPAAFGTDLRQAITQLPVADVTRGHMADMPFFHDFAQRALGINDQMMAMDDVKSHTTASANRINSSFGVSRQKVINEFESAMGWSTMSAKLVQNSQQYWDVAMKMRLVGDRAITMGPDAQKFMMVDPISIAGFYDFVPVNGTMPIDRYAQAVLWQQLFGTMSKIPQILMQYDLAGIFSWVAQLAGLTNINRFRLPPVQTMILPPGQNPQTAGAGNVVPITAGRGPAGGGQVPEPAQQPGMGQTV